MPQVQGLIGVGRGVLHDHRFFQGFFMPRFLSLKADCRNLSSMRPQWSGSKALDHVESSEKLTMAAYQVFPISFPVAPAIF
jgi:hypothetical protein